MQYGLYQNMVVKSLLQVKLSAIIKLVIKLLVAKVQVGSIANQMLNQTHLDVYLTYDTQYAHYKHIHVPVYTLTK